MKNICLCKTAYVHVKDIWADPLHLKETQANIMALKGLKKQSLLLIEITPV